MHEYRVAVVRAWLAVLVTAIVACRWPAAAMFMAHSLPVIAGLWLACCGVDVCPSCDPDATNGFELDFAGIVNDVDCSVCADYNTVFILDGLPTVSGNACSWGLTNDPSPCSTEPDAVTLDIQELGGDVLVDAALVIQCPDDTDHYAVAFRKTYSSVSTIDCTTFAATDIPYFAAGSGYFSPCNNGHYCDGTAATCAMTNH